jgi:hypothetical protein
MSRRAAGLRRHQECGTGNTHSEQGSAGESAGSHRSNGSIRPACAHTAGGGSSRLTPMQSGNGHRRTEHSHAKAITTMLLQRPPTADSSVPRAAQHLSGDATLRLCADEGPGPTRAHRAETVRCEMARQCGVEHILQSERTDRPTKDQPAAVIRQSQASDAGCSALPTGSTAVVADQSHDFALPIGVA